MTTTINASTAGAGGLISTADNSGVLALQTAGVTQFILGAALSNYVNDSAAESGGIPLYGYYRNGSIVMQRVT